MNDSKHLEEVLAQLLSLLIEINKRSYTNLERNPTNSISKEFMLGEIEYKKRIENKYREILEKLVGNKGGTPSKSLFEEECEKLVEYFEHPKDLESAETNEKSVPKPTEITPQGEKVGMDVDSKQTLEPDSTTAPAQIDTRVKCNKCGTALSLDISDRISCPTCNPNLHPQHESAPAPQPSKPILNEQLSKEPLCEHLPYCAWAFDIIKETKEKIWSAIARDLRTIVDNLKISGYEACIVEIDKYIEKLERGNK